MAWRPPTFSSTSSHRTRPTSGILTVPDKHRLRCPNAACTALPQTQRLEAPNKRVTTQASCQCCSSPRATMAWQSIVYARKAVQLAVGYSLQLHLVAAGKRCSGGAVSPNVSVGLRIEARQQRVT
ncbi:hypothetical protein PMIN04_001488 [Paraphaeosphaeria minitans]